MRLIKVFTVGVLFFLVVASAQAQAQSQSQDSLKLAFVDLQRALVESAAGKNAMKTMESKMEEIKTEIQAKKAEIERLESDARKSESTVFQPEYKADLEMQLQKKARDYQRFVKDAEDEMRVKEAEMTAKIGRELSEIVEEIGKEGEYTLIFDKNFSGLLYAAEAIELTNELIRRYNETKVVK